MTMLLKASYDWLMNQKGNLSEQAAYIVR